MNPRHAAALALVGWYLMMPPHTETKVLFNAPLKDWVSQGAFDSAEECDNTRVQAKHIMLANSSLTDDERKAVERAQCVATDDPRLKGN